MDDDMFNFDKLLEGNHDTSFVEEEEDADYDALNSETFGENIPSTDWEEEHAKLAESELERNATNHSGAIPKTTSLKRDPSMWTYLTDEEIEEIGQKYMGSRNTAFEADYGNPPAQLPVATLSQSPSRVWALSNDDKENATNHKGAIPKTTSLNRVPSLWNLTDEEIETDNSVAGALMSPTDPWRETNTHNNQDILPNDQISTTRPDPWRETNTHNNQDILPNDQISTTRPDPWRETNTHNNQDILPNDQISITRPDPWRETNTHNNQDILPNDQISTTRPDPWRETNTHNNQDILPNGRISTSRPVPWRETNTQNNHDILPNDQISTSQLVPWRETNTQNNHDMLPNDQMSTSRPSKKILTVAELEKNMREEAVCNDKTVAVYRDKSKKDDIPTMNTDFDPNFRIPTNEMQNWRNQPRRNPQHVNNQRGRFRHPNSLNDGYHRVPPPHSYYNPAFVDNRPHQRNYGLPAPPRHHHPGVLLPPPATTMWRNPQHMRPQRAIMGAEQPCDPYYGQASGFSQPGTSNPAHHDEYAGLMSSQEKQWLANIQMMQLNSHQPYKDDYYYTMYQHRQQGNSGRKFGNHGHKNNRDVPATNKPASTYVPLQFENSLGKLQIGSVTAPRKIIDMDLVENVESSVRQIERKSKQILLEIEELINKVLLIEETFIPMAQRAASELSGLDNKIMNTLLTNGKLGAFMSIRKGKKTILRILPLLNNPSTIVHKLLEDLEVITKKDQDQLLLSFLPAIRSYLSAVTLETLVTLTAIYKTKFLLSSKFTVSVIANMVERAGIYLSLNQNEDKDENRTTTEEGWKQFWLRLLESVVHWKEADRPVVAMDPELFLLQAKLFTPCGRGNRPNQLKLKMALCNVTY